MINSLRLQGHDEPIHVLDCGLEPGQRELLAARGDDRRRLPSRRPPQLLKTVAPLRHPAEVMVLIDVDMIVTRPLGELIELAAHDRAWSPSATASDRFFAEWGELLDLGPAAARPVRVLGPRGRSAATAGAEVLRLLADRQRRVDFERTLLARERSRLPVPLRRPGRLQRDPRHSRRAAEPRSPLDRAAGADAAVSAAAADRRRRALRCAYADGAEPFVLHQFVRKPWLEPMYHGIYSRLLVAPAARRRRGDPGRRASRCRCGCARASGRAASAALVDARDLGRCYLGDLLPALARLEDRGAAAPGRGAPVNAAAFYCVADARYFLGAVGDDQLAAPARPRRAGLRARLRARRRASASCSPPQATIVAAPDRDAAVAARRRSPRCATPPR